MDLLENLARRHGYAASFERTGSIALGRNERHARAHRAAVGTYRRLGLDAEALDRPAVRQIICSSRYLSGFHVPHTTALIDPWQALQGLRRAALAAGVRIHESTPVERIEAGEVHRIVCPAGVVRTPALVLATNGYSPHLGFFRNRVAPVHVSCIATEPLDAGTRASLGWSGRQSAWEEGWLYHFFRLTPDNRVLLGGGWAVYRMGDRLDHPGAGAVYRRLEAALRAIFPQLRGTRVTHRWSGPVGFTRDFLPSLGTTGRHDNIYYAVGYSGHGVAMSHLAAEILCALYSGERSAVSDLFLVDRPLKTLLADPFKWMVITAVRNGYLMLDRLGI
jgi:glycine/D-amino acid oxidase-like deaminating enzyme